MLFFAGINVGIKDGILIYDWLDIGMMDYDDYEKLYAVKVMDESMYEPVQKRKILSDKNKLYHVPRIRLMFYAEDPNIFVARVKEAYEERKKTEALLRLLKIMILSQVVFLKQRIYSKFGSRKENKKDPRAIEI